MLTIPREVWDAVWSNQERICFEDYRLSTFMCLNWLSVSVIRLAASGFYYDAILDDIICFSCGICKRDWGTSENKVAISHLLISNKCLHANFRDNRNVPAISGSTYPSIPSSNDFELTPSMQFGIPEENESSNNDDGTSEEQMTPRTLSSARFSALQTSNLQNHSDHVEYNEEIRCNAGQESTIGATANGRIIPVPRNNQMQPGDTLDEENARLQNMPPDKAARWDQAEESLKANQHDGEFQENMILIQDSTESKDNGGSEPEQCILDMRRAASPEKASVSTRLSTFGDWPGTGLPSARSLVIAGFYYMGTGDSVRCFYCGVTLRHWREHDDPWVTHLRFCYSCDYVTAVKGEDFVITSLCNLVKLQTDSSLSNNDDDAATLTETVPSADPTLDTAHVAPLAALQNDDDAATFTETVPSADPTGLDLEPGPMMLVVHDDATGSETTVNVEERLSPSFSNSGVESRETRGQGNSPSQTTDLATKLEQVKKPSDTAEATNSDEPPMPDHQFLGRFPLCIVCCERSADTIFLPCGHLCMCEVCADSLSQCCLCPDRIRGTAHVYFE